MPVVAAELKLTVEVSALKVPVGVNTVPWPRMLIVDPVPALKMLPVAIVNAPPIVILGEPVAPIVVVLALMPSPIIRFPRVIVP